MFDSEGIYQIIYIVAEHKVIFLAEEGHQLLMTAKRRNSDIFFEKIPFVQVLIPVTLLCSWTVPDREQDRSVCPV
jgi:hypothetical protein